MCVRSAIVVYMCIVCLTKKAQEIERVISAASSKVKWVAGGETIKFHQRALYGFGILYQMHVLPIQINNGLQHLQPCFKQKQHKM